MAYNSALDLTSPVFAGAPCAPTAAPGDNTNKLATTAFVTNAIATGGGGGGLPLTGGTLTGSLNMTAGTYQYAGKTFAYIVTNASGDNIFLGESGNATMTGNSNVASGPGALAAITSANANVAIGMNAGTGITTGANNTFVGFNTGRAVLTAAGNTAVGNSALKAATSANNTVVGYNAAQAITTGASNTVLGSTALQAETTGSNCVALGFNALGTQNGSGGNNIAIGYQTGLDVTTGSGNTFVGHSSGRGVATGSQNTVIGYNIIGLPAGLTGSLLLGAGSNNVVYDYNFTSSAIHTFSAAVRLSKGYATASLPAAAPVGATAYVTDGAASLTWGATVTGGGSATYLVWYNGAHWTVVGQ